MDGAPATDRLAERILAAGSGAAAVLGPAASGKTTLALELYQRAAGQAGAGHALLLAPNGVTAAALRKALLQRSEKRAIAAPRVTTFAALAARILAAAGRNVRALSPLQRHLLIRRIVRRLAEAGQLRAIGPVSDTPGLIDALERSIAELKRAAVDPEHLAAALHPRDDRSADLLAVYRQFQAALHERNAYDAEGRAWLARDMLASADRPPGLDSVRLVAADGFTDFTPTQLETLTLLARGARVVVTLPWAADGRDRLWHWTSRTRNALHAAFGDGLTEIVLPPADNPAPKRSAPPSPGTLTSAATAAAPPGDLSAIRRSLFDPDAAPAKPSGGLKLIAAVGGEAEISAVATEVKRLLLAGAPAGSIAVLARTMDDRREAIHRIFTDADIPTAEPFGSLADEPIARFLLCAAAVAPQFASRDVLRVIRSSYFRPEALGEFSAADAAATAMLIREGNVLTGRESYAKAADRLARRAERDRAPETESDDEPTPACPSAEAIRRGAALLEAFFGIVEGAAAAPSSLIDALDLHNAALAAEPELAARDLRALAALREALEELAHEGDSPDVDELRHALAAVAAPAARGEQVIDVLDVLDARAPRYRHVFLLGVNEGQFPRRVADSSLLSESDRRAWAQRGVRLDLREDLTAREMLLLYLAATRADATLTVSWLEADAAGRAAAPSGFVHALAAPAGGLEALEQAGALRRLRAGQVFPLTDCITRRSDAVTAAIAGPFSEEASGGPAAAHELAPRALRQASAAILAAHHRWREGECDRHDGRLDDPALLRTVAERFGPAHVWSAHQLDAYAACPWRFFAEIVLDLAPLPEPARRMAPVTRGAFCHEVLCRVFRRLAGEPPRPVRLAEVEDAALTETLDAAVAAAARRVEAADPPYPRLWAIQRQQMRDELLAYLQRQKADASGAESLHFELSFAAEYEGELQDAASRTEPVPFTTPGGEIRTRGKIDRVDRLPDGKLLVVDYKTGALPTSADLAAGRNVQMPLYTVAAEAMLDAACAGGAFHSIRDGREAHFSELEKPRGEERDFAERMDAARETIAAFVAGARAGRFDALPAHHCSAYCPYRQVCGYSEPRADRKRPTEGGEA